MSPILIAPLVFVLLEGARHFSEPFSFGLAAGIIIMAALRLIELRATPPETTRQGDSDG